MLNDRATVIAVAEAHPAVRAAPAGGRSRHGGDERGHAARAGRGRRRARRARAARRRADTKPGGGGAASRSSRGDERGGDGSASTARCSSWAPRRSLLKGGHGEGAEAVDIFVQRGGEPLRLSLPAHRHAQHPRHRLHALPPRSRPIWCAAKRSRAQRTRRKPSCTRRCSRGHISQSAAARDLWIFCARCVPIRRNNRASVRCCPYASRARETASAPLRRARCNARKMGNAVLRHRNELRGERRASGD